MRNKPSILVVMFAAFLFLFGCVTGRGPVPGPPALSVQQRAAMQTRELQGDFDTAFSATISVLQDQGWQIDFIDKSSGLIQATSLKRQDIIGPAQDWYAEHDPKYRQKLHKKAKKESAALPEWTRWEQLTAHIEPWAKGTIRHRITITKYGSLPANIYRYKGKKGDTGFASTGGKEQSIIIENPATYQYLFQQIQRAIFIRKGLTGKN